MSVALHTRLKVWSGQDCEALDKGLRFQFQLEIHTSLPQMLENNKCIYICHQRDGALKTKIPSEKDLETWKNEK